VKGSSSERTAEELRADIERTRSNLDETVDAIGERLRPANLAQEGWERVKARSGRGVMHVVDLAREHPVATAAIGTGVAIVMMERARRRRSSQEGTDAYGASSVYDASEPDWEAGYEAASHGEESSAGLEAESRARRARVRVAEAASGVKEKVGDMAGSIKDRSLDVGRKVRSGADQAREGFWDLLENRPLVAGAASLAVGVLVGLAVPATRREDRLMGDKRDDVVRGARDVGRRTLDKTKEVARTAAEAAQDAARDEAERQNLVNPAGGARGTAGGIGEPDFSPRG